jgi:hypothetical protein
MSIRLISTKDHTRCWYYSIQHIFSFHQHLQLMMDMIHLNSQGIFNVL